MSRSLNDIKNGQYWHITGILAAEDDDVVLIRDSDYSVAAMCESLVSGRVYFVSFERLGAGKELSEMEALAWASR